MAKFTNAVPASLRRPPETSAFVRDLTTRSGRMTMMDAAAIQVPVKLEFDGFAPLPEESADAKLTGLTRSLTRRLMGLNIPKQVAGVKTVA